MTLNDWFPHKLCINLERRPDRWKRMQARFRQFGIDPIVRLPAIDSRKIAIPSDWKYLPGTYGCKESHILAVNRARHQRWPSVLILEDDVVFDPELSQNFGRYAMQVPGDWDMLFFGCIHDGEPVRVAENVVRVTKSYSTYAYAIRDRLYDAFIDLNQRSQQPVDDNNLILEQEYRCYCFMPHLAWVDEDYSDAQHRPVNFWWLKESLVLGGVGMERVLNETAVVLVAGPSERGLVVEALGPLIDHYSRSASVGVIEYGAAQQIRPGLLPRNCAYGFVKAAAKFFRRSHLYNEALNLFGAEKFFFVFVNGDFFLKPIDLKANLMMCGKHDAATSFRSFIELNREDSLRAIAGRTGEINTRAYEPKAASAFSGSCILTRPAISVFGEQETRLRLFRSPNLAFRLTL